MTDPAGSGMRLAVLIGHPRPGSRTHSVAVRASDLLRQALIASGVPVAVPQRIDLAELASRLLDNCGGNGGSRGHRPGLGGHRIAVTPLADLALATVTQVPLLLVASPTFRGSCSGLLKLFLDLLPRDGLESVVAVPLMTAGMPEHRCAVDTTLRPVLAELRAQVPAAGISVLETELTRFDQVFDAWWAEHGTVVEQAVRARVAPVRDEVASC